MTETVQSLRARRLGPEGDYKLAHSAYNPLDVYSSGKKLASSSSIDQVEYWAIAEQTLVAALDAGKESEAYDLLEKICEKFSPDSSIRSAKLMGMFYEYKKEWAKAMEIYIEKDDTSMVLKKRLVAVLLAQGRREEAISTLTTYLDTFMSDVEAWTQLSSLYLAENLYQKAAFCVEELILLKPNNHHNHIRYADIMYTLNQFEISLKHYAHALELCEDNVRALYGLRLSILALESKSDSDKGELREKLKILTGRRLIGLYEGVGKEGANLNSVLKAWLQN
ncbi:ER membrane complex subunit 2 [Nowakowskiella sp. JEL0407]|nr:ER membrane complex subunit 2 [Nowakowskiella sp. JEL0407]